MEHSVAMASLNIYKTTQMNKRRKVCKKMSDFLLRKSFFWVWGTITKFPWWNVPQPALAAWTSTIGSWHATLDLTRAAISTNHRSLICFLHNSSPNLSSPHRKQDYKCIAQARSVWAWSKSPLSAIRSQIESVEPSIPQAMKSITKQWRTKDWILAWTLQQWKFVGLLKGASLSLN